MRVVVGPVSGESARAWLDYADAVISRLDVIAEGACYATDAMVRVFEGYVRSWRRAARGADTFVWEHDLPAEEAEFHFHAFFQVATLLAEREAEFGESLSPPEGDEFYLALINGIVVALSVENDASAEFASHLAQFWPGLERSVR